MRSASLRRLSFAHDLHTRTNTQRCAARVKGKETATRGSFAVDKHSAFQELHLKEIAFESIGRVRQHVNPLSLEYRVKSEAPLWESVFENPQLPLIVDAGTGYGRFPLLAAKNSSVPMNYLGTEIRRPLIGRANIWAKELGLDTHVHFLFANITLSLHSLLEGYPGEVSGIYIQFPDPCFKKKQVKRHIVQPSFVEDCGRVLKPGGVVFMQSDVESCAVYSRNMFDHYGAQDFTPHPLHTIDQTAKETSGHKGKWGQLSWLEENPIGFPTEREVYSQAQGLRIYRTLLVKASSSLDA